MGSFFGSPRWRVTNIDEVCCDECGFSVRMTGTLEDGVVYGWVCPKCHRVETLVLEWGSPRKTTRRVRPQWLNYRDGLKNITTEKMCRIIVRIEEPYVREEERRKEAKRKRDAERSRVSREERGARKRINAFKRHVGLMGSTVSRLPMRLMPPLVAAEAVNERRDPVKVSTSVKRVVGAQDAKRVKMLRFLVKANRRRFGDLVPKAERLPLIAEVCEVFLESGRIRGREDSVERILAMERGRSDREE